MADVTGAVHRDIGGTSYSFRLTNGALAQLQAEFGADLGGLLTGKSAVPDFRVLLRVAVLALMRGTAGIAEDKATAIVDDLSPGVLAPLIEAVIEAAFPPAEQGAEPGNGKRRRG